ncbi:hypothetical protein HYR53_04055 [Candidatus Acetothermia bacterium]|nr:hypothetical protein [Candidatus Acetothermia bacterium]
MNHTISLSEQLLHLKEDTGWPWKTLAVRVSTVLKDKKPSGSTLFRYAKGISHPADDVEQALLKAIQRIRKKEIHDPAGENSRSVEISKRLRPRKKASTDPLESQDLATPLETERSFTQSDAQVTEVQPNPQAFHESAEKNGLEANPVAKELLHLKEDTGWSWLEIANRIRLVFDGESPNGSALLRYVKGYATPSEDRVESLRTAIQQVRKGLAEPLNRDPLRGTESAEDPSQLLESPELDGQEFPIYPTEEPIPADYWSASSKVSPEPSGEISSLTAAEGEIPDLSLVTSVEPLLLQETPVVKIDDGSLTLPTETEASAPDSPIAEALIEIKKNSGLSWTKIANELSSALGTQKISGPTLFRYVKGYLSPTADAEPLLLAALQKVSEKLSSQPEVVADPQNLSEPAPVSAELSGPLPPTEIHVERESLPVDEISSLQLQADDPVSLESSESPVALPTVESINLASNREESAEFTIENPASSTQEEHQLADQLSQELHSLRSETEWTWRQVALRVAQSMPSGAPSFSTLYRYAKGTALPTAEIAAAVMQAIQKCRGEPITEASQPDEFLDAISTTVAPQLDATEWQVLASIPQPDLAASQIQIEVVPETQRVIEDAAPDEQLAVKSEAEVVTQIESSPVAPITEMPETVLVVEAVQDPDISIASAEELALEDGSTHQISVCEIPQPIEQVNPEYDPHQDEFVIFCRSRDIFFSQTPEEMAVS